MKNKKIVYLFFLIFCLIIALIGYYVRYLKVNDSFNTVESIRIDYENKDYKYSDELVTEYKDYLNILSAYNISGKLTKEIFDDYDILVIYDIYDSCSEEKVKEIRQFKINHNSIDILFEVFPKCGVCEPKKIILFIPIEKNQLKEMKKVNKKYEFKKIEC